MIRLSTIPLLLDYLTLRQIRIHWAILDSSVENLFCMLPGFLHTEPERARFTLEIWIKFDPAAALFGSGGGGGGGGQAQAAGTAGAKAQAAAVVAAAEAAAVSATALGGHKLLQVC